MENTARLYHCARCHCPVIIDSCRMFLRFNLNARMANFLRGHEAEQNRRAGDSIARYRVLAATGGFNRLRDRFHVFDLLL